MTLFIPTKFEKILKQNNVYHAETLRLISKFSEWIKENKVEFFPEYTDHGIEHIQSVLNTAENITNDKAFDLLNSEDIFVLVSSILLHDCAMHIDKYGLWSLLKNDNFNGVVLGSSNTKKWIDKWKEFNKSVSKFDENDWHNFFGKDEVISLPNIDDDNLGDKQKIIIGDFIRQHHADIAQIIASFGIPIKDGHYNIFNSEYTTLNQLSGFIARSHNYNLRDMVDELGGEYQSRNYLNTHPAFLMGLLRISDYLQFKQDRTPKILFKIRGKGMCSPISIREWKKHLSILHTNQYHSDSELLFVEAHPNDAQTLEDIQKLFKGFQNELDSFWAVNGEIYSRYGDLSLLGINIRRIKSNIDNPNDYIKQNNKAFYPEILSIKSDNQKILPLLVAPLYGDNPSIGLRELVQNSIDACNEKYSTDIDKEVNREDIPYKIDIIINLDNETVTIEDDGIGMDINTVKNYFLKVGASYRYSEVWKSIHSNDDGVYVPRTGKFGIGMLAGFLIGDEISILSKKNSIPSNEAISFIYSLHKKDIQVNFTDKVESGTKITIKSNKSKLTKLVNGFNYEKNQYNKPSDIESFWYFLDTPVINIKVIKDIKEDIKINPLTIKKGTIFSNWNSVENTELEGFYWNLSLGFRYYSDKSVFCNGILIRGLNPPTIPINIGISSIDIKIENICIFDNYGKFPLNLTRDSLLIEDFFEIKELSKSVIKVFFEHIYLMIDKFSWSQENILEITMNYFKKLNFNSQLPFILFENKVLPIADNQLKDKYVLIDFILEGQNRGIIYNKESFNLLKNIGYTCMDDSVKEAHTTKNSIDNFILNNKKTSRYYNDSKPENSNLKLDGWVFVKKFDFKKLWEPEVKNFKENKIIITDINDDWIVVSSAENSKVIPEIGKKIINVKGLKAFIFVIVKFNECEPTEFSTLWNEHIK